MSTMNMIRYRALCRYAGEWLDEPIERSFAVDEVDSITARSGVYVICEPLERVQYVGSVHRPGSSAGVADRLREHLREGTKRLAWKRVWVLPLKPTTPRPVVRLVEACVGADLGPLGGDRLPRL
jgi:hypothetical protein